MTGIPIVNNGLWVEIYYLLMIIIVAGFAGYDSKYKRVPNRALAYFIPYMCLSLPINRLSPEIQPVGEIIVNAILGTAFGGTILLAAAVATNGGIGGGDIKLMFLLGFVYGPFGILLILLIAASSALLFGLLKKLFSREKTIRLAFVPFILLGCAVTTLLKFM
jgi:prepilin signal peptidase PulO-like enzyme (type II secretory pathway)